MIVSWLFSRVQYGNGQVEINTLYDRYRFECLEANLGEPVTLRHFIENLTAIFPDIKRKRKYVGDLKKTFYEQIVIIQDTATTKNSEFSIVQQCLIEANMKIECSSVEKVSTVISTGHISNGMEIMKTLTFHSNGSWTISVAGTEVALNTLSIDNNYSINKEGIHLVCKIAKQLRLCYGIVVSKSVIVSRFHIIENWKTDDSSKSSRILRSLSCNKIVNFTNQCNACIICQNMTFKTQECKKNESEVNNEIKSMDTTKDDFKKLIPSATDEMLDLLMDQAKNCERSPNGRRWNQKVISICLKLYSRSPYGYETLKNSNILILPSPQLLILYKNAVKQDVGFQDEVFEWMYEEACRLNMSEIGWSGGLIFDEMAIQTDLQISKSGDVVELKGFVDMGEEANMCNTLRAGVKKQTLGTHVLQIVFLGLTGFRFPVAHFVTSQVQGPELFNIFWEAVDKTERKNFQVLYTCMDGAQCNRTFMHINFEGTAERTFIKRSFCSLRNMVFMMDFSHVAKKIRNNVLKSGVNKGCTRILTLNNGRTIQWKMFIDAYDWDKQNCLSLHRKLSHEHIYPNNHEKMRNHLAEEALNSDMLHLMSEFQSSLGEKGHELDGAIEFLGKTSQLISIFRDMRPIKSIEDNRLMELRQICDWFHSWKLAADKSTDKDRYKSIMSLQCHEDIQACGIGFIELCKQVLPNRQTSIIPGLVNSDTVENHFNQQRSTYHGANTNPNINQYCNAQNSIIIGQSTISRKANVSRSKENITPCGILTSKTLRKKRNELSNTDNDDIPKKTSKFS